MFDGELTMKKINKVSEPWNFRNKPIVLHVSFACRMIGYYWRLENKR